MDAKWKGNEREVVPFDARKGTSYRKRNKVEGEFGEEAQNGQANLYKLSPERNK